jgi:hypothetical protein
MVDRNDHQDAVIEELSSEELEQVHGGGTAEIHFVEVAGGDSYQGKRSTSGYVPT